MCGPSSAMKDINQKIQGLASQMTSEAKTVFTTAKENVDKILGSVNGIIDAGSSHMGFSQTELNARNAAAIDAGAAEARNLKAAAGSAVASIGGGNAVMPSGTTTQILTDANVKAAEDTASQLNKVQQEGYERGNQDYWRAIDTAERAPSTLGVAEGFNNEAMSGEREAATSQQNIDNANNWWKSDIMKIGSAAAGFATGGLSNLATDSSFGENVGNFFKGGMGSLTGDGSGTKG